MQLMFYLPTDDDEILMNMAVECANSREKIALIKTNEYENLVN